ncbi:glycosyltransferase [Thalassomonas viridans]|uniref:Glycosyltransferase n=1 Tax=Thalassomonas viridans TaxID=137584 RepID=A0AAF0C7B5_9GAMM|nr:glycosyltransferase [Thalassomonas viridans]WDE03000.1 glycosyltransferase [Thalassomonas viridans]
MKRDIIVFGEDWGALPSSTQHIIRHLSYERKVIWVNSIGLRHPQLTVKDLKRLLHKFIKLMLRHKQAKCQSLPSEQFVLVNPQTLPAPRHPLTRKISAYFLVRQLKKIMRLHQIADPVLWTSLPTAVDVVGKLGESSVVYYCGDDFSALTGVDHHTVTSRESELVERAQLILTASELLTNKFPAKITHALPHGVDFDLFANSAPRAADLPADGRPIAGFYGSISPWLDIRLLEKVTSELPNWHFVFIGEINTDINSLQHKENVHFLGPRAHHLLPTYCQHWTVSLLPFCNNAQIRACNPLKLREYLAAGRPVVSTAFPALKPYGKLIDVIHNAPAMVNALKRALSRDVTRASQKAVLKDTWAARANQVSELVDTL